LVSARRCVRRALSWAARGAGENQGGAAHASHFGLGRRAPSRLPSLPVDPAPAGIRRVSLPGRAAIHQALALWGPVGGFVPLSVIPYATLLQFVQAAACVLIFVAVRQSVWWLGERSWRAALPLAILASAEALLGLAQAGAAVPGRVPSGTYVNHNHFAGLLEMVLPFAVLYPVALWSGTRDRGTARVTVSCLSIAAAAVMLAAILCSLSRMGLFASLAGLAVCGVGICLANGWLRSWGPVKTAVILAIAAAILVAAGVIFLPPDAFVQRFGTPDNRSQVWKESLPLLRDYWLFGCGAGGFESVFMKYKRIDPMMRIDYVHNDYLQRFIELGAAGCAILACLIFAVMRQAVRAARACDSASERALAVACLASLAAILLHSAADFNLYIPANAMVFAWVCGIAVSILFTAQPAHLRTLEVLPSTAGSVSLGRRI
jgi:O-antigen ligase